MTKSNVSYKLMDKILGRKGQAECSRILDEFRKVIDLADPQDPNYDFIIACIKLEAVKKCREFVLSLPELYKLTWEDLAQVDPPKEST